MNDQTTVNELVKQAIKFLAEKNQVSESFILKQIASLDANLIKQINALVMSGVSAIWEEYHK
jgi:hypothetical protein